MCCVHFEYHIYIYIYVILYIYIYIYIFICLCICITFLLLHMLFKPRLKMTASLANATGTTVNMNKSINQERFNTIKKIKSLFEKQVLILKAVKSMTNALMPDLSSHYFLENLGDFLLSLIVTLISKPCTFLFEIFLQFEVTQFISFMFNLIRKFSVQVNLK